MQVIKEQIQRFLDADCTAQEAEAIAVFLRNHPEILNSYLQQDWDTSADAGQLPAEKNREMYLQLLQQLSFKKRPLFSINKMRLVVAAAVLLLLIVLAYTGKKQPLEK